MRMTVTGTVKRPKGHGLNRFKHRCGLSTLVTGAPVWVVDSVQTPC